MARLSSSPLSVYFFLLLLLAETWATEGEKNRLVVGEVGSSGDSHNEKQGRVDCKNNRRQCKDGNGGVEGSVFEAGDYIYTNSNP